MGVIKKLRDFSEHVADYRECKKEEKKAFCILADAESKITSVVDSHWRLKSKPCLGVCLGANKNAEKFKCYGIRGGSECIEPTCVYYQDYLAYQDALRKYNLAKALFVDAKQRLFVKTK